MKKNGLGNVVFYLEEEMSMEQTKNRTSFRSQILNMWPSKVSVIKGKEF